MTLTPKITTHEEKISKLIFNLEDCLTLVAYSKSAQITFIDNQQKKIDITVLRLIFAKKSEISTSSKTNQKNFALHFKINNILTVQKFVLD